MKRILLSAALLSFLAFSNSYSQDQQNDQAGMKAWQDYMTPGQVHQMMSTMAGKWKTHSKYWMAASDTPMEGDGEANFEMILGGRYLKSSETGTMMNMPFEAMMLEGYDNAKKEFTDVWIDNFGTGTMVMKGKWDNEKNLLDLAGTSYDPMSGKDLNYHQTVTMADKDTMLLQMYLVNEGKETKVMEVKYARE